MALLLFAAIILISAAFLADVMQKIGIPPALHVFAAVCTESGNLSWWQEQDFYQSFILLKKLVQSAPFYLPEHSMDVRQRSNSQTPRIWTILQKLDLDQSCDTLIPV